MSKVLFIKYVPHLFSGSEAKQQKSLLAAATCSPSTVIVLKYKRGLLNIQGFPEIPCKEKAKAWDIFMQSVKQLLAVPVDRALCIRFSDSPCTPVTSIAQILQEPTQIIHLIASPLPYTTTSTIAHSTLPADLVDGLDPYSQYNKMFHSKKGKAPSTIKPKCKFSDMERLLSQLEEVNQCLERTREACDKMTAKCSTQTASANPVCSEEKISSQPQQTDEDTDDQKVENLLQIAESIIQPHINTEDSTRMSETPCSENCETRLPDAPTDVSIQPSLTPGAVYIMWHPVRLDVKDMNHGHTVLGYKVYFNKHLKAEITGALSSQAELLSGLEEGELYSVQVCTHTDHCNSLLSAPFQYRHTTKQSPNQSSTKLTTQDSKTKAARVESWLLNGHISSPTANHSINGKVSPNHHVHFAASGHTWGSTQLLDSGCEDTRSTASSHTSGIVTDFPMSPYVKQAPSFSYDCPGHDSQSLSTALLSDDGFHTLTRCACLEEAQGSLATKSSISSTLCPSQRSSIHDSMDTVIDEPFDDAKSTSSSCVFKPKQRRPAPPENFTVYRDNGSKYLLLEWTPVRRDEKGCNNGFFILGYRIYVNDRVYHSVNGAVSAQVKIKCPENLSTQHIKLDIRSRAMASESIPSNAVCFNSHLGIMGKHSRMATDSCSHLSGLSKTQKSALTRIESYV